MTTALQLDMLPGDGIINAPDLNQEVMVNVFRFFRYCETQGICTVIASNWGSGGTGEQFHDEANPLGENAWIMAAWNAGSGQTFYVLAQWADSSTFGASPGNPGLLNGSSSNDGVGFQLAVRDDGTNPWNGTSNDDGSDTKGATVWTDGGSTVRVFPRSNATGGSHVTNKENLGRFTDHGTNGSRSRMHFAANEETLLFICDNTNDATYGNMLAMGQYTPVAHLSSVLTTPFVMIKTESDIGFFGIGSSVVYGGTTGTATRNGGICAIPANDVMDFTTSAPSAGQINTQYQPNQMANPNVFETTSLSLFGHESGKTGGPGGTGDFGLCGFMDISVVAAVYNSSNHQTNAAADVAYIGTTTIANRKFAFPWDGGALPGTGTARTGRQAVIV